MKRIAIARLLALTALIVYGSARKSQTPLVKLSVQKIDPWREKAEEALGTEGLEALSELHSRFREIDHYQIDEVFPKIGGVPPLVGVLDALNYLSLEVSKPDFPVYPALKGKLEELEVYLEKLKEAGYFPGVEPELYKRLKELMGEEKAKRVFTP